ncbi:uncharacterized protein WM277_023119 isoform 2-T2 [Molossus nigricans]
MICRYSSVLPVSLEHALIACEETRDRRLSPCQDLREECLEATPAILEELQKLGYRVSAKKAQLCTQEATYLGYQLKEGRRSLSNSRIEAILRIPTPATKRQSFQAIQRL